MRNPIAFELTVSTTPLRLSATRLVADVTLTNATPSRIVYISTDAGATRASLPANVQARFDGVDLHDLYVYANGGSTVVSVVGNTR